MAKLNGVYKCAICGNIVEVLHASDPEVVCCGQPMDLLVANTVDASKEKHVPVIEKTATGVKIKVGAVPHPMEEKHFIEFIECITDGVVYRKALKPGDAPEAEFCVSASSIGARIYCNLHGLWSS